jgi:hypothetical protein
VPDPAFHDNMPNFWDRFFEERTRKEEKAFVYWVKNQHPKIDEEDKEDTLMSDFSTKKLYESVKL